MKTEIVLDSIVMTCGGCPSQWNALDNDGNYIYIRYRHGNFTVEKDKTEESHNINSECLLDTEFDIGGGGFMETKEMIQILKEYDLLEVKNEN